jgi:serine/threonine protein kinase
MDPSRWEEVKEILNAVLELPAPRRSSYLDAVARKDPALRQEVQSLLAADEEVRSSFLQSPPSLQLAKGTRLGEYEVQSMLGAGGMGEVYRARDLQLKRDVAIKVLPAFLSSDPDRLRRFEQEATAVAALSHPSILSVFQLGRYQGAPYMVTELLEGETLREHIRRGPMGVRQALEYAVQIALGLAAAHERGIVHRDLKPENLFITRDGRVKILDFGLAKVMPATTPAATATHLPCVTQPGVVIGTAGYMSPEQVQAQATDHRSDIFSFGAILYEMLTGKRAFEKATPVETMAAILNEDSPSLSSPQLAAPPALDWLVRACLTKDQEGRWRDAHDLRLELERIRDFELQSAGNLKGRGQESDAPSIHASLLPPEGCSFLFTGPHAGPVAVSPDGRKVAFTARREDTNLLFVRSIDSAAAEPLSGTEGAIFPFWSPDSRSLGFFSDGYLRRIEATGGPPHSLWPAPAGRGGSWNREGTIIFTPTPTDPIYCIPAAGGTPHPVTTLDPVRITTHRWPCFLPDGRHFLYFGGHPVLSGGVYVGCLDGNKHKPILQGYLNVAYAPTGFLLFVRDGNLVARRFDTQALEITGDDFFIADEVIVDPFVQHAHFSVSENGVLVFHRGGVAEHPRLTWFHRNGKPGAAVDESSTYVWHRLSPDGRKLAGTDRLGGGSNVWILDLARQVRTRLTFDFSTYLRPTWSPDGSQIVFSSNKKGTFHIYQKASSGAGSEELLLDTGGDDQAEAWSPDGKYLAFLRRAPAQSGADIWIAPSNARRKPFPLIEGEFDKRFPTFSPDGRWLAYASSESGRFEVHVTPFPGAKSKWQVSSSGGTFPRWRGDGKELFYLGPDQRIRATEITARGSSARIGSTQVLFRVQTVPIPISPFDVTADGRRFLINAMPTSQDHSGPATILTNWMKKLGVKP